MNPSPVVVRRCGALSLLLLASSMSGCLHAQAKPDAVKPVAPQPALLVTAIAGQSVPVLPLTYVIVGETIRDAGIPGTRVSLLAWADSITTEEILARAPEVTWIVGAELRRKAGNAPGMIPAPDRLGQAALRFENIKRVPDPLFGYLRTLVALSGGRLVLVPASVRLTAVGDSVRAETMWVMADGRTGSIIWRSAPAATALTAAAALKATIDHIFPDAH